MGGGNDLEWIAIFSHALVTLHDKGIWMDCLDPIIMLSQSSTISKRETANLTIPLPRAQLWLCRKKRKEPFKIRPKISTRHQLLAQSPSVQWGPRFRSPGSPESSSYGSLVRKGPSSAKDTKHQGANCTKPPKAPQPP
jgi:hypothetical protein